MFSDKRKAGLYPLLQKSMANMHKTKVIITVDTEPSIAGAMNDLLRYPPLLEEPVWGEVNGKSEALGFIIDTLKTNGLRATFFVETAHTCHFGSSKMQPFVNKLSESQQDIQLHIHPVWLNFRDNGKFHEQRKYSDDCTVLDQDTLNTLIIQGMNQIESWTGIRPIAMRTGNFFSSHDIYSVMAEAGIKLSSNICIGNTSYRDMSLHLPGGIHLIDEVLELPTTCFIDRRAKKHNHYRPLQVTACSSLEMLNYLKKCHALNTEIVVITTHPFEYIKRKDFRYNAIRPNKLVQNRFKAICQFLVANENKFLVTTFSELANTDLIPTGPLSPLRGNLFFSLIRSLENFINDRI